MGHACLRFLAFFHGFVIAGALLAPINLLSAQEPYNNESVIKLSKAGLSDDLIISTIKAKPGHFDTSPDGIIALKSAGVSDKVIAALVERSSNPSPPAVPEQTGASGPPPTNAAPGASETSNSASSLQQVSQEPGSAKGFGPIRPGARVVIAPMGGFETYFAAAVREKKVPVVLTLDKTSAQYFVVSTNTEWQGFVFGSGGNASWTRAGGNSSYGSAGSSTRGLEASIMLIDANSKDVIWAYEVHKSSHGALIFGTLGARGQQSIAEACAKHLREYIEKGK